MIKLRDTVFIDMPPGKVWKWLEAMPEHYLEWHADHISCRWLRGDKLESAAEMEIVERLHGKEHRLRMTLTGVEPGRRVDYRIFPGLKGSFEVETSGSGSVFTAIISIGVDTPILGKVIDNLLRMTVAGRIEAIRQHQAEEGANLKVLLGGETSSTC